jgi:hypothetical protein
MEQLSNLPQELHRQIVFASLLHHLSISMRLPLYALQLLGLTLNRSSQRKRNSHVHVIYSCYNLLVRTILQMKESPQLTSFHQVTSPQINSCDECAQHAYTPQTSQ